MNWSDIIVAVIALIGTFAGTAYGIHKANNLTIYRLEQLEKKVDVHNEVQDRVLILEQKISKIDPTIDKLQERVAVHGEQIDGAIVFCEKNEYRIQLLEKLIPERS